MDLGTKRLVARVVGAQGIAVHNQHPATVEVEYHLFRQQRHAALASEALAQQEITVAVNKVAGDAAVAQRSEGGRDLLMQGIGIVVANPGFKEIAQNIERVGVTRRTGQKT